LSLSQPHTLHSFESVNRAFSKQSLHYDLEDRANPVLSDMREQVYAHVSKFLKPGNSLLELNAGTGIDALHFALSGYSVHATDLSDGMVHEIRKKITASSLGDKFTSQQLSYDQLHQLHGRQFEYVFSNFGGLNCIQDLASVTKHLPGILKPGACITWVIMPPVCPWELLGIFKGRLGHAFRRFHKDGVMAHLEGEYFKTYYHSLSSIKEAFGRSFTLLAAEGLAALTPQPHRGDFPAKHPVLYKALRNIDRVVTPHFPFNRWADHIIVTFQFRG
jgi:ubiquinone/menaquinone biosynthesis C-methylase UbiE